MPRPGPENQSVASRRCYRTRASLGAGAVRAGLMDVRRRQGLGDASQTPAGASLRRPRSRRGLLHQCGFTRSQSYLAGVTCGL